MSSQIIQAAFRNGFVALQRKPGQPGGSSVNFAIAPGRLNLTGSVGRAMPETVLRKMEQVFKASLSDVRIYEGPQAGSIGAHAFTMGSSIYFAPGQYSPDTARGQQLLGHELAHVLQQRSGRVRAPQGGGMVVVNDHALEAEADRMGAIAASFRPPTQGRMAMPGRPSVQAKPAPHMVHRDDQAFSKPGVKTRSYNLTPVQAKAAATISLAPPARPRTRQFPAQTIQRAAIVVPDPLFDEEELAEMANDEDHAKLMLEGASAENKKHFATYLAGLREKKKWAEVLATRKRGTECVSWDFDNVRYHINLRTATNHVTRESIPKVHYFFKGTGDAITDERPTPGEAGAQAETKKMFSALPPAVQKFVKENYLLLLL